MDGTNQARGWALRLEVRGKSVSAWRSQLVQILMMKIPASSDEKSPLLVEN